MYEWLLGNEPCKFKLSELVTVNVRLSVPSCLATASPFLIGPDGTIGAQGTDELHTAGNAPEQSLTAAFAVTEIAIGISAARHKNAPRSSRRRAGLSGGMRVSA
ncbi:hypothetical protein ASE30_15610 [Achromobacter sp. Root83]|nr:hypothetical protein ASE30_15610 [Achromobacter sp. Root83]